MKKTLPILLFFVIVLYFSIYSVHAKAQDPVAKFKTTVTASVGEFYLSVSGFISPYASIVLTTKDGVFLRAGVADAQGNFSISHVLIKRGFDGFCLTAIDFKRLGESVTCFTFPPAEGSITMTNIFLPPTLGLSRTEIAAGESVIAFGYTMPGAVVTLKLSDGKVYTTIADSTGYYEFKVSDLRAGEYKLFATAHYKGQESLSPTKQAFLRALSLWEQFIKFLKDLWNTFIGLLTSLALGPLWLLVPLIILIIILLLKLWPEKFTFIYHNKISMFFQRKLHERPLHHWWFVGY